MKIYNYRTNILTQATSETSPLLSLRQRRILFDLCYLHKLLNNKIDCPYLLEKIPFIAKSRLLIRPPRNKVLHEKYSHIFVPPLRVLIIQEIGMWFVH